MNKLQKASKLKSLIEQVIDKKIAGKLNESTSLVDMSKPFLIIRSGGSIGEIDSLRSKPEWLDKFRALALYSFDDLMSAKNQAKSLNSRLSPGEKEYYKIKYSVVKNPNSMAEE